MIQDEFITGGIHSMRCQLLSWGLFLFLCLGCLAQAQESQGGSPPGDKTTTTSASEAKVAPDAGVITIEGLCDTSYLPGTKAAMMEAPKSDTATPNKETSLSSSTAADATCKTVVTRAQFEILVNALNPQMPPDGKHNLAERYPEMLLHGEKIHELGVDQDPVFTERIKFAYLQVLGRILNQYLQEKANDVSDAEVEKYYKEHPESFQRVDLMRIFILNHKVYSQVGQPAGSLAHPEHPTPAESAADAIAMKAEAEKIHKEAVAGVSFEKLQDRAYKVAQDPDDTPPVKLGQLTADQIPAEFEKAVFDLPVGKISDLVPASNGWHIFKVLSKDTVPLSEAKPIVQKLRMRESMDALKTAIKVQLNPEYFTAKDEQKPIGWR
jgi:hypothetical protein